VALPSGTRHVSATDVARDLDHRVFEFACRIVDVFELLNAKGGAARVVGYQLLDAGTSVGSNYEEAGAGQTKADFISKLCISRKESRESLFGCDSSRPRTCWLRKRLLTTFPRQDS
jgi:four helix bundle protein